jgi:endonuclease YncB( thermonuclease family)
VRGTVVVVALVAVLGPVGTAQASDDPVGRAAAVCADHPNQASAQNAADTRDGDGDGIYCESLPCPCSGSSAPAPAPTPVQPLVPQPQPKPKPKPKPQLQPKPKPNRQAARRKAAQERKRAARYGRFTKGTWQIVDVLDGDTVRVRQLGGIAPGPLWSVNLIGVDTPETGAEPGSTLECGGRQATGALLQAAFPAAVDSDGDGLVDTKGGEGRRVRLRTDVTQSLYEGGRLLAYVDTLPGDDLGLDQLGWGWSDVDVPGEEFTRYEQYAGEADTASAAADGAWEVCEGEFHLPGA